MSGLFDLSGRVAIVTGGGTGIGLGIARALAGAGAALAICGRRLEVCESACDELQASGALATAWRCDVTSPAEVEAMVAGVLARFGHIDILVNNAGTTGAAQECLEIDLGQWRQTLATNLDGVFLCSQAVARRMVPQRHGKIINIASIGSFLPLPMSADYSASTGGVLMLTRAMALELVRHNIQVNAICPGYVDTGFNPATTERVLAGIGRKVPAGHIGQPADLAGAAVLLASPASDYMVGSSIVIDGGVMLK
jgi:NAD(P)-dependent dehydrogenase (short-subunit alcohol dehydrogenase family)